MLLLFGHNHLLKFVGLAEFHGFLLVELLVLKLVDLLLLDGVRVDFNMTVVEKRDDLLHGLEVLVVVEVIPLHVFHFEIEVALDSHVVIRNIVSNIALVVVASILIHVLLLELNRFARHVIDLSSNLVLTWYILEEVLVPVISLVW